MKKRAQRAGQSLVEIIVAVGVVALLVTGVVVATTTSLRSTQSGRIRGLAVQFTQEGIEAARSLRDAGWAEFVGYAGLWCLAKDGTWTQGAGTCPVNIDGMFTRSVTFVWNADETRMEVTVSVSWVESGIIRTMSVETFMTNWN